MATLQSSYVQGVSNSYAMWVNFYFTGGSVGIRGQFNVSSIGRNGQGDYTINFSTTLSGSDYAVDGSSRFSTTYVGSNWAEYISCFDFATTSVRCHILDNGDVSVAALEDPSAGGGSPYGQTMIRVCGRYGV